MKTANGLTGTTMLNQLNILQLTKMAGHQMITIIGPITQMLFILFLTLTKMVIVNDVFPNHLDQMLGN